MDKSVWKMFSKYHYLDSSIAKAAKQYVCYINGELAGFISVMPQPNRAKNYYRINRLVVLPDYQGVGIGIRMLEDIADLYTKSGYVLTIVSSAPSIIGGLNKNKKWQCIHFGRQGLEPLRTTYSTKRITASFKYIKNNK